MESRCSRPDASTDAKQLLPSVTLAVSEIDKQLQALQPQQISKLMNVRDSHLGLLVQTFPASLAVATQHLPHLPCAAGDVIISCNGLIVQTEADLKRAMRFSDSQTAVLEVVPAGAVDCTAPLAAGWTRTETIGGHVKYENSRTHESSWLHPQLHLKPTSPVLVSLSSYYSGMRPVLCLCDAFCLF
jgi:hypothetical protein